MNTGKIKFYMDNVLKVTHNAGFFSCCTIRLMKIIDFFNENGKLPDIVDSSEQFQKYKLNSDDITHIFFEEKVDTDIEKCEFHYDVQFLKYDQIELDKISKFVKAYFTPSQLVKDMILYLENKYHIDYDNTCSIFYRGNDKSKETKIGHYDEYFKQVDDIIKKSPNIRFHIQTDESEFIDEFTKRYTNNFYFDETPTIRKSNTTVHDVLPISERIKYAAYFLAATIIVSKSKYIITHSGNCGIWSIFYRGNVQNTYQYLNHKDSYIDYSGWIIN